MMLETVQLEREILELRRRQKLLLRRVVVLLVVTLTLCLALRLGGTMAAEAAQAPTEPPTFSRPPEDIQPPVISGSFHRTVTIGDVPDYLGGVTARDNADEAPELTADDSMADLTRPGVYFLIYQAQDAAGNVGKAAGTVTVVEPKH